eukprot:6338667-Prymnesium_polylepis.1
MARVRDARTKRAGSHAEFMYQAGAGTARGSVRQGSGMGEGGEHLSTCCSVQHSCTWNVGLGAPKIRQPVGTGVCCISFIFTRVQRTGCHNRTSGTARR